VCFSFSHYTGDAGRRDSSTFKYRLPGTRGVVHFKTFHCVVDQVIQQLCGYTHPPHNSTHCQE